MSVETRLRTSRWEARASFATLLAAFLVVASSGIAVNAAQGARGAGPSQAPASQPGPLELRAKPITPENPIPRRVSSVPALYPGEAAGTGATGTTCVQLTLDASGRVAEARATCVNARVPDPFGPSSPTILRALEKSSIDAVRQWVYDAPAAGPITFSVTLSFTPGSAEATMVSQLPSRPAAPPGTALAPFTGTVDGVTPIRVGGNVMAPQKIRDVKPVYPPIALSAKVSGVVILEAVIGADGRVVSARVIRSIPLLDQAAIDAVSQWEFTPTLLNGVPTPIIMSVTVNFQPAA